MPTCSDCNLGQEQGFLDRPLACMSETGPMQGWYVERDHPVCEDFQEKQ